MPPFECPTLLLSLPFYVVRRDKRDKVVASAGTTAQMAARARTQDLAGVPLGNTELQPGNAVLVRSGSALLPGEISKIARRGTVAVRLASGLSMIVPLEDVMLPAPAPRQHAAPGSTEKRAHQGASKAQNQIENQPGNNPESKPENNPGKNSGNNSQDVIKGEARDVSPVEDAAQEKSVTDKNVADESAVDESAADKNAVSNAAARVAPEASGGDGA